MSEKEFLALVNQNQGIIYKLVRLYASSEEDKKDFYQEILLQAWKTYPAFRGSAKFSTWLYQVSLNTILTLKRKVNRIEYTDTLQYEQEFYSYSTSDDSERLYQALRTLPETERAIACLHLEGYENKDISEMMGITPNLAGVKLFRIREKLARILKDI